MRSDRLVEPVPELLQLLSQLELVQRSQAARCSVTESQLKA